MLHLDLIGPDDSDPYLGIIGTWFHCMDFRLVSAGPVNSGPYLGSSGHGSTAWPAGWPHLDLGSGVATWDSPMLGDTGTHVGLTWTW